MDDSTFDRLTRFLGTTPTRRDGIGLAITAALGAITTLLDRGAAEGRDHGNNKRKRKNRSKRKERGQWKRQYSDTGSEKKRKGKGKGKKKPKQPIQDLPQSPPPPGAPTWKQCGSCSVCQQCNHSTGQCAPDPSKNGLQCGGCHTCRDGSCNAPADSLCGEDQRCNPATGICCPVCQSNGSCCPSGSICINPGPFSANFCCDTTLFDFCGSNGDGTFQSCCARDTHRCLNDQCVRKDECPDGWKLCPGGDEPFCAPEDFSCCGGSSCNTLNECCDAEEGLCCLKGLCAGGMCCTGNREMCGNQCCDFGKVCCGSQCCSPQSCVNGECCPRGVCGDLGGFSRVCPFEQEFCCHTGSIGSMSGYACPLGDGRQADCAPEGKCCPAGTEWNTSCDLCCEDLFLTCEWNRCVPPTPGRLA